MKNIVVLIILSFILIGCTQKETPDVQATIDAGIAQTQTREVELQPSSTPEPTETLEPTATATIKSTSTPEYCPMSEYSDTYDKLKSYSISWKNIFQKLFLEDYSTENLNELIDLRDSVEKESLAPCWIPVQNSLKKTIIHTIQTYMSYLAKAETFSEDMELVTTYYVEFVDGFNKITQCVPNCKP